MKEALLYGLSAVMLLSLTACGTAQANQPDEPDPKHTTSAVQTKPPQETVVPSDKLDNVVEPLSANGSVKDATGTELDTIFEQGYQGGQIYAEFGLSEDELILMEVGEVESILGVRTDVKARPTLKPNTEHGGLKPIRPRQSKHPHKHRRQPKPNRQQAVSNQNRWAPRKLETVLARIHRLKVEELMGLNPSTMKPTKETSKTPRRLQTMVMKSPTHHTSFTVVVTKINPLHLIQAGLTIEG